MKTFINILRFLIWAVAFGTLALIGGYAVLSFSIAQNGAIEAAWAVTCGTALLIVFAVTFALDRLLEVLTKFFDKSED